MLASYSHKTYYARKSKMHLVLSAKIPYRAFCEGFFVSSVSKSVTKMAFRGLLTCTWRFTPVGRD